MVFTNVGNFANVIFDYPYKERTQSNTQTKNNHLWMRTHGSSARREQRGGRLTR